MDSSFEEQKASWAKRAEQHTNFWQQAETNKRLVAKLPKACDTTDSRGVVFTTWAQVVGFLQ